MSDSQAQSMVITMKDVVAQLKQSAFCFIVCPSLGQLMDPTMCLQIGAAIACDKPIIVVAPLDGDLPSNLRRVASVIIRGEATDNHVKQEISNAITGLLTHDARVRTKV